MPVSDWADLFQSAGRQYGIDPALLQAMATTESGGDLNAVSPQGAIGPMQLMPETARALGVTDPKDPKQAIPAAARLLSQNGQQFGGPEGAILAYHGGTDKKAWGPKTQAYLAKVSSAYQQLKNGGQMAAPAKTQPDNDAFSAAFGGSPAASKTAPAPVAAAAVPAAGAADAFSAAFGAPANGNSPSGAAEKAPATVAQPSFLKSASEGVIRGYKDVVGSVVPVDAWIANKLGFPETANRLTGNLRAFQGEAPAFRQQYGAAGQAGEALGQIATSLPAFAAGGEAIAPIAAAARTAVPAMAPAVSFLTGAYKGNKLLQLASHGAAGAAQGGAAAALTSGGSDQPFGQQVQQGAEFGGGLGMAAPALVGAGSGIVNRLTGGGVSPAKGALANTAINQFGIPLRGSQISNSPFAHYLDSAIGKVPFSGMEAQNEAQRTAFSRAVAGTFGETADNLTPQVMSTARTRIGQVFNDVASRTGIKDVPALMGNLGNVIHEATQTLPEGSVTPLMKQVENIGSVVDPTSKTISGEAYQALTRRGSPLDRAMNSSDSNIRYYAGQIKDALDDSLQASASQKDLAALKTARLQWKNMRTVQDLASKAGIEGEISPALLLGAVKKSYKDMSYSGAGDIGKLAHIGQQFLKEPASSGTGERIALYDLLKGGAGGIAGALTLENPNQLLHAGAMGAGLLGASRLIGSGLKSRTYRDMLLRSVGNGQGTLNSAFGGAGTLNNLTRNAAPYALPAGVIGAQQFSLNTAPASVAP